MDARLEFESTAAALGAMTGQMTTGESSTSANPSSDLGVMRAIVDAAPDCIMLIELDGRLSFMNANGRRAMEIDDWASIEGGEWAASWPESTQGEVRDAVRDAALGRISRFEAYCPTAKGSPRWWDVYFAPMRTAGMEVDRVVAVARDVTERVHRENQLRLHEIEVNQLALEQADMLREQKASIDESDALIRAVDHRMKNSLAMLGSLLKMETNRTADATAKATLKAAAARVSTIASVHEQLHLGSEKDALALDPYLAALVRDLVNSMAAGPGGPVIATHVAADDIVMRGGKALALGLATVELVMNAIRHGHRDGDCTIEVECRQHGDMLSLVVADRGPGLPAGFDVATARGLGMRVVQSSLAKLGGTLTCENRPHGGATFRLDWPS